VLTKYEMREREFPKFMATSPNFFVARARRSSIVESMSTEGSGKPAAGRASQQVGRPGGGWGEDEDG
jgi:hypothetical protein